MGGGRHCSVVVAMGVVVVTLLRLGLGLGMVDTSMVTVVRTHVATVHCVVSCKCIDVDKNSFS